MSAISSDTDIPDNIEYYYTDASDASDEEKQAIDEELRLK
jgi:hypothetical protein